MKIAIILGTFSVGERPLDFLDNNIWDSSRGLTGTDLTFCMIAKELKTLGHEIHLFTIIPHLAQYPNIWEGCFLHHMQEKLDIIDKDFSAVISLNEPDVFRGLVPGPKRILWQMLNDFNFCEKGFDNYVDLYLGVCQKHTDYLKSQTISPEKWDILELGCDPSWYDQDKKVDGRIIYCSSPDRGLHWALNIFPEIKKQYPKAHFKIFYHFGENKCLQLEHTDNYPPVYLEIGNRLRYCKQAIENLKDNGVEHLGSVSVNELKKEMSEAEVLLYPVDTVSFSEGFSISILSAHASGAIPVISSADCIGEIYKDSGSLMVEAPVKEHLKECVDFTVRALKDKEFAAETREKCLQFSQGFSWSEIARKMEVFINN